MIDHINSLVLMSRNHVLVAHHNGSARIQRAFSLTSDLVDVVVHDVVVGSFHSKKVGGVSSLT